ncbi:MULTISPECIES: ATP-binding cassette domain-containing protein [unclassified Lactobacillus]|uniref:ATP-binding cassette domain-containing protein n=1 Tax=unclassified Lactobacillus TaxID=2620435 RepID=UPI000EFAB8E6|nr:MULTISPECIES: ATP-binding cassette domain-containing protein [unclassified Lactobacillus]RMC24358.1 ATP-binding cassette domain-containing protein [Lactobacillus sp. ESL0247]RMC28497.1 ATP-binding cassette domain-containing protein [Lactobacillus sp. ESL0246]RMC31688.1 ATP-binding cassette domain-containing protein [Lactobacillus sp. ESL0245]
MSFIELKQVGKVIKKQPLLHDINANIHQNSITVLEGINGSGKTLILKALLGLIKVTGSVLVNQQQVLPNKPFPVKAGILIEKPSLIEDFTAYKNLELLIKLDPSIPIGQINDLLQYFDLNRFPKQKVKKFSLGMKQKLGIAQAFLGEYPLIILDEPTNALDQKSILKLVDLIKSCNQRGTTFIIASHDLQFIDQVATSRLNVEEGTITYEK